MRPAPLPGGKTVKIPAKYLKTTCKAAFSGIKKDCGPINICASSS
jgi:hypothetical protein